MTQPRTHHWALKTIHWLVALMVIGQIPVGLLIAGYKQANVDAVNAALGPGAFDTIYDLHKSGGLMVLGLMILRVVVRASVGTPDYVPPLKAWERVGSRIVHFGLYALLIVTPIVGWLGVSLYPAPVPWYFLVDLRLPVAEDRPLSESLLGAHDALAITVAIFAAAHILAALKHWLVNRDRVMQRMTA